MEKQDRMIISLCFIAIFKYILISLANICNTSVPQNNAEKLMKDLDKLTDTLVEWSK
jgi:hypothetical protein